MTSPIKIAFSTTEYERSHCRQPRGRGSWAFQVIEVNGYEGESEVMWSPSMTYTEAKKWAAPKARAFAADAIDCAHHVVVNVLP